MNDLRWWRMANRGLSMKSKTGKVFHVLHRARAASLSYVFYTDFPMECHTKLNARLCDLRMLGPYAGFTIADQRRENTDCSEHRLVITDWTKYDAFLQACRKREERER